MMIRIEELGFIDIHNLSCLCFANIQEKWSFEYISLYTKLLSASNRCLRAQEKLLREYQQMGRKRARSKKDILKSRVTYLNLSEPEAEMLFNAMLPVDVDWLIEVGLLRVFISLNEQKMLLAKI